MGRTSGAGMQWMTTLAAQLVVYLQGFVVFPVVIRLAGEETYGVYVLLASFLGLLFNIWTSSVAYRYRRNLVSASGRTEMRRLFEPQFTVQLLAITVTAALLLVLSPNLNALLFGGKAVFSPWLLGAWLEAQLLYRLVQDFFRFTFRFTPYNMLIGGFPALYMAFLVLAAVFGARLSVDTLLTLQIVAYALVSVLFLPSMIRELGLPRLNLPWRDILDDLRLGFPLTLQLVVTFILASSDRYLISAFLTVADVGRYQPAYQLGWALVFFPTIGYVILAPALWRMVDAGKRAEAEELCDLFTRLFLMLAAPFVVGALLVGPSVLGKLANPNTGLAGNWVIPLVALAAVPYTIYSFGAAAAFALNRTNTLVAASLIGAVCNLALNLLLLPVLQTITEPAASTLVGYAASAVYLIMALRPGWTMHFRWLPLLRFLAASAAMAVALWFLGYRPGNVATIGVLSMAAAIIVAVIVYFGALWALGGLGRREREEIASLTKLGADGRS